jgi:hypothetical protein
MAEALVGLDIRDGGVDTAGTVEVLVVDTRGGAVDMADIDFDSFCEAID